MPKIINKRKSRFVILDRELMADKRLKSNHKILYALLCSLSESCDDVFPSYKWLAENIGYETKDKTEQALQMFMTRNFEPLVSLGLVEIVKGKGQVNDYAVNDYIPPTKMLNPQQKCEESPNINVGSTPNKNVKPLYIEKEDIEKEEDSRKHENFFDNKNQAPKEVTNFIEFFDLYPKKEKLEFAQREYNRLIRSHEATHEQIMQGARTQLESLQNREYKYIPLPETWLRSKAFLDQKPTENQTQPTTQTQQKQSKWHLQPKIVSQWDDETNEDFEERCRNIEDTELMHTMRMYKRGSPKTGWSEMFVPQY